MYGGLFMSSPNYLFSNNPTTSRIVWDLQYKWMEAHGSFLGTETIHVYFFFFFSFAYTTSPIHVYSDHNWIYRLHLIESWSNINKYVFYCILWGRLLKTPISHKAASFSFSFEPTCSEQYLGIELRQNCVSDVLSTVSTLSVPINLAGL